MPQFSKKLHDSCGILLNNAQKEAFQHENGPALTLSIPGSGKTTVILSRSLYLIHEKHVDPKRILSLTFSKASATDMTQRFQNQFSSFGDYPLQFSTIHRYAYRFIHDYYKNRPVNLTLIEGSDSPMSKYQIIARIYRDVAKKPITDDLYEEIQNALGLISNLMLNEEDYLDYGIRTDNIETIRQSYRQFKKKNHMIDFDDMLTVTFNLLNRDPLLLKKEQSRFDYIQLDEAQDTSKIQHEIIRLLAKEHQNIFMVADDDQSIYGFRGAYPEYLLNFKDHYPEGKIYRLDTNYRSDGHILKASDDIIKKNINRYDKVLNPYHPNTIAPILLEMTDLKKRNKHIVSTITKDEQSAVLYRNNLSVIPLLHDLNLENIDFTIKDGDLSFFKSWILKDVKAFFRLSLIPQDLESFRQIAYKTNGYISRKMVQELSLTHRNENVFESIKNQKDLKKIQIKTLTTLQDTIARLTNLHPQDALDAIGVDIGYFEYLKNRDTINYDQTMYHYHILKYIAKDTKTALDFLERLDNLQVIFKNATKNPTAILKLSTIHSSKGLEYDHVHLIDLIDGIFPSKMSVEKRDKFKDIKWIEEDRRLLYVAMTRAKKTLTIYQHDFIQGKYITPSEFIRDLKLSANIQLEKEQVISKISGTEGQKVQHKSFGAGTIMAVQNGAYKIKFRDKVRELSIDVCEENKLLQFL